MTGCATSRPPVPETMNLVAIKSDPKQFIFPRSIVTFAKSNSWAAQDMEETIVPGKFIAREENDLGTFYQSTGYVIGSRPEPKGQYIAHRGGFWISKTDGIAPQMYVIAAPAVWVADLNATNGGSENGLNPVSSGIAANMVGSPMAVGIGTGIAAGLLALAEEKNPPKVMMKISNPAIMEALLEGLREAKAHN